jgi:hypothetical protein
MATIEKSTITIRQANYSDNAGLVELTSLTPMMGKISIRVDRKPDFFGLLEMRGSSFVFVAEFKNKIIGSYSVSAMKVFIAGEPQTAYYIGDFKVHPDFRKSIVALKLARHIIQKLQSLNADLLFSAVIAENKMVTSFLKENPFLPTTKNAGKFNVYQIIPSPFKSRNSTYQVTESFSDSSCTEFFNDFTKQFLFGPVYNKSSFENTTLITATFNNEIIAAISLIAIGDKKQEIVIKLPFHLKIIGTLFNAIHSILPAIKLPNEKIDILYIKSFACKPEHKNALKLLLARARNLAYEQKYHFLCIGIHEKSPWKSMFSHYPAFRIQSNLFVGSLKNDGDKINSILDGIPFLDYSLV